MSDFTNIRRVSWHSRGFLATQTAYVTFALVLLILGISTIAPVFLSLGNINNVLTNFSYIGIVSLGSTVVIITGGIDLSIGSTMGLSAIITALLFQSLGATGLATLPGAVMVVSVFCGLLVGALIGLINGLLIARAGLA